MVPPAANAAPGSPVSTVAARRPDHGPRPDDAHRPGVSYGGNAATRAALPGRGLRRLVFRRQGRADRRVDREAGDAAVRRPAGRVATSTATTPTSSATSSRRRPGMPLDQFFKTRIFDPLKMTDTQLLPAAGEARSLRGELLDAARTARSCARQDDGPLPGRLRRRARAPPSRAAPACCPPPPTTPASCRCC